MNKWFILVGVVFGIATVVLLQQHISSIESDQVGEPYLTLKEPAAKGTVVTKKMIGVVKLPVGRGFEQMDGLVVRHTKANVSWIVGRKMTRDVPAGFLLYDYFSDDVDQRLSGRIKNGYRAITIPVSTASSVGHFVEPGSRVDILATFTVPVDPEPTDSADKKTLSPATGRVQMKDVTRTIQQNVRVLAVGKATTRSAYRSIKRGYDNVTFEVTPEEAEKLVFAMSHTNAGFMMVLRNPEDFKKNTLPMTEWNALFEDQ